MFTLTKLTPPPPVLLINLTICLCFSLPAHAKIIQRKMHMVCQEHESAYWDGSKGVCCDGSVYQPDIEDTSYACCPTGKEVSIVMGKENLNHCCSEGQKAYWSGSSAQCCATATHQIVTNYINGQTETAYACCKTKEDTLDNYSGSNETDWGDTIYYYTNHTSHTEEGYTIAGAINGSCCGGYISDLYNFTETASYYDEHKETHLTTGYKYKYAITENGGTYYCAKEELPVCDGTRIEEICLGTTANYYVSPSKVCYYDISWPEHIMGCNCSDKGDPRNNGDPCDP